MLRSMDLVESIREKFEVLRVGLNETMRRRWAAAEARALGRGGSICVAQATGLSLPTIRRGLRELAAGTPFVPGHLRRTGGGRKPLTAKDPTVVAALDALVEPLTRGDPMSPLRWTCKSTGKLALELQEEGYSISDQTVARLLHTLGYSLQAPRKMKEGSDHPDRNAQFEHINLRVIDFQQRNQPVISVDAKKKELVGDFANKGREWQPSKRPEQVRVHDFPDEELGKAIPYGVYDMSQNTGWVSVGTDHDTAAFAVASIRQWWRQMGSASYPWAEELLITADGGGSNSARSRLWKVELQRLADETGLRIHVSHLPPGTSKWNKIEHRLFCHITQNWRGRPLLSHEVIVNLLGATTTTTGLKVQAEMDETKYPTGIKVSDEELGQVRIMPDSFHGEWNYLIVPKISPKLKS
jgi:transposase